MQQIEHMFIEVIAVPERLRSVREDRVVALAESITEIGLKTPVTVRVVPEYDGVTDVPVLVAGRHRLEACRRLGWEEIEAIVLNDDEDHCRLWEIDENLARAELTATEEAEHLAERKAVWERIEAAENNANTVRETPGRPEGFVGETARSTGKSKRHIQKAVKRAGEVTHEARELIRNTVLDTGTYLDKLMSMPADQQVDQAHRDLEERAQKEKRDALRREKAARDREAKEVRDNARIAACDLLVNALNTRQWDQLVGLIEQAGGSLKSREMRDWQAPSEAA